MRDRNDNKVVDGSVINMHQTINGQNLFIIKTLNPLDVRYFFDIDYKYEYDKENLVAPCELYGDVTFEVVANLDDELECHMFIGVNKIFNINHFEFNGETEYEFRGVMNDKVVESEHAEVLTFSYPCIEIDHERVVTVGDFLRKIK